MPERGTQVTEERGTQVTEKELDGPESDNRMLDCRRQVVEKEAGLYMKSNDTIPEKADLGKDPAGHKSDNNLPDRRSRVSGKDQTKGSGDHPKGSTSSGGSDKSIALKVGLGVGLGVGATVTVGALVIGNLILPGIGFAAGGILANSLAAGMMSSAAIANGGAIAAGSGIAIAQSIGATGVSLATGAAIGVSAGAGAGAAGGVLAKAGETITEWAKAKKKETNEDAQTEANTKEDKATQTE